MDIELIRQLTDSPVYTVHELPATIGNAIYSYGSNEIREIIAYIDTSKEQNGSEGIIITPTHFYSNIHTFAFDEIEKISTNKHRDYASINGIHLPYKVEGVLAFFSDITDLTVLLEGSQEEKIEYYLSMIIEDLLEDAYEDIELTYDQRNQLISYMDDINSFTSLKDEDLSYEAKQLLKKAYPLLDDLGLDSTEMDELEEIYQKLLQEQEIADKTFENASRYYEDMLNNLKNGDSRMYNQMKSLMKMIGIDEEELKNKSPEELNEMLDSLCKRFGITKEQVEAFAKKYQH